MRRVVLLVITIVAFPVFFAFAVKADKTAVMESVPVTKPTGDELNVNEFELKRIDLVGKVVELRFNRVRSVKEVSSGNYMAVVQYYENSGYWAESGGVEVLVPKEGMRFFETPDGARDTREEQVYVQVLSPTEVKALGKYYAEDEKGLHYGW